MSALGKTTAVISVGCSCQTALQIDSQVDLLSQVLGESLNRTSFPFDWLIMPPTSLISWISAELELPVSPDEIVSHPNFLWPKHGLHFWHEFTRGGKVQLAETFSQTIAKFEYLRSRFFSLSKSTRRIWLYSNTQNNLDLVRSVSSSLDFSLNSKVITSLAQDLGSLFEHGTDEFIFLSRPDWVGPDAFKTDWPIRVLRMGCSDIAGDSDQWAAAFRDLIVPQGKLTGRISTSLLSPCATPSAATERHQSGSGSRVGETLSVSKKWSRSQMLPATMRISEKAETDVTSSPLNKDSLVSNEICARIPIINYVRHGALLHYSSDRVIGTSLTKYGEWAEEEIYLLKPALPSGACALDIGANIGTHTLAFSRLVGPTGRVLSFEGQRAAFSLLAANMLLNRCENVHCIASLVGNKNALHFSEDQILADAGNLGSMCFKELHNGPSPALLLPVPLITVDSLSLSRCDLLKIDVEGMELEVLEGARDTLHRHRPVIYFEQAGDSNLGASAQLLTSLGYILRWHHAHPFNIANFRGERDNIFGSTRESNIVAVHPFGSVPICAFKLDRLEPVETVHPGTPPVDRGWALPVDAYSDLSVPRLHEAPSFEHILAGSAGWGSSHGVPHGGYAAAYAALAVDRAKAQVIMEYLSGRVSDLEQRLADTSPKEMTDA